MAAPTASPFPHEETYLYAAAVTIGTPLTIEANALYVGTAGASGTAVVNLPDGTTVTFVGIPAGTIIPLRNKGVASGATTVSNVVALF